MNIGADLVDHGHPSVATQRHEKASGRSRIEELKDSRRGVEDGRKEGTTKDGQKGKWKVLCSR